jgi:hypothetical protein
MGITLYDYESRIRYFLEFNSKGRIPVGRAEIGRPILESFASSGITLPAEVSKKLGYLSRDQVEFIKREDGTVEVIDLSRNGICVNGSRLKGRASKLKNRDLIRFGPEEMGNAYAFYFYVNGEADRLIGELEESRVPSTVEYVPDDLKPGEGNK